MVLYQKKIENILNRIFFCCQGHAPEWDLGVLGESKTLAWGFAMASHRLRALVKIFTITDLWQSFGTWCLFLYWLAWTSPQSEHSAWPQIRVCNWKLFFYFSTKTYVVGTQKEPSQWDGSFEYPKHMLKLMDKKLIAISCWHFLLNWPFALVFHLLESKISYVASC